jgi:DNA-binding CsgD family transcriptional regulator
MPADVIGRETELASLRDFASGAAEGAAALALEGEAGIGKTTLWAAGIAMAEDGGARVLRAQPVESETTLSFAGIGDLLDPVLEEALEPLPAAQRSALSRALMLEETTGPAPDPRAVGVAVLGALRALAADATLVVAVDDVQWLDSASAAGLAYAARRLRMERVGVLLARRSSLESALLVELRRSLPPDRYSELEVGPLPAAALHRIVRDQLGATLPRPLLSEVQEASGGNPFYALEIVRTMRRSGISVEAGQPLPVPESLHELVHERLLALPPESRDFLLAAAAHAHPRASVCEAASGVGRGVGLTPALEAHVVELDRDRIRFTHPLLAAGAYEIADPTRRVAIHARLAELLENPEARAWQLAASVDAPDDAVATALVEAAWHARARGAPRPAALLLDRACELTPRDRPSEIHRRAVDAAYLHFESGDSPRAAAKLRKVISSLPPGRERARAVMRLARVRSYEAQDEAVELFLQAVEEAEGDREILAVAHEGAATCLWRLYERLDEALEHADLAAKLALETGNDALAGEALGTRLQAELLLGRETAGETAALALTLQPAANHARVLAQPRASVAMDYLDCIGELERAREELEALLGRASELGDESSPPFVLAHLSQVECELGEFESARGRALEGQDAAEQAGQRTILALNLACEGLAEARKGQEVQARDAVRRALELVPETGGRQAELVATHAIGHLELALDNPAGTLEEMEPVLEFVRKEAIVEPAEIGFVVDHVEALLELGRRDEAVELLDWYEANAHRLERAVALANCARCRGLLAAQVGDREEALAAFEEALAWHSRVEIPLDRGRTLLALGVAQRRAKRRREARATLEEALAVFEGIGAALWAERARGELKRISGRAPAYGALTPAEERVAALVAEGKTNREVAAALYLSERTVEGHLSHVFGKLGIKHRAELARALQTRGIASSNTGGSPVSAEPVTP